MNDHELVRPLLALGAAGLLDADGERRLREHTAACAECRAELETFAEIAGALGSLPAPPPPPDLLWRTQALLAAEADRREGVRLAGAAAAVAAVLLLAVAATLRTIYGDTAMFAWLGLSFIPSALGGAAALTLASRRQLERSSQ
jgi:predicted anti-sigma-YlaC factor YlaD